MGVLLFSCVLSFILLSSYSLAFSLSSSSSSSSSPSSSSSGRLALRHSFKAPFTNKQLPFWSVGAGAIVNDTYVRLTPARQSRTGYIWNTVPCSMIDWEVVVEYRVSGHANYGGDGFAFWYVEKSETLGNVYGSMDYWVGLAITFDTFNNDGIGKSPLISAIYNDGTQRFDSFSDGASQAAASCSYDFRNTQETAYAKITYQAQKLTLQIGIHRGDDGSPLYQPCFEVEKVDLGVDKYFGLSAHTGDVADNHDIHSVLTRDLSAENADIESVRKRFRASLSAEQSKHLKGEMSQNDFQHHIVTTLSQMQEELNLLELGQIAINDWLNTKTPQSAAQLSGETNAPAIQNTQTSYAVKFDQTTMQRISTLIENQQTILREIKTLQTMLQSASSSSSSSSSSSNANAGLMQSFITHTSNTDGQFRQIREQLNTFQRRVDEVINNVLRSRTPSENASADSDEVGWSVYVMIIFIASGVGSVALYNFRQHSQKERYKMI